MLELQEDIYSYLKFSRYINGNEPIVQRKAMELKRCSKNEIELVKNTYYYARDENKHSWDVQDKRIKVTAFDVLREGVVSVGLNPIC